MVEDGLAARSALGAVIGAEPPPARTWPGLTLRERTHRALAAIAAGRGRAGAVRDAIRSALGIELPGPGQRLDAALYAFAWTGPDQWFAAADLAQVDDIVADLGGILGDAAAITEQTDAWAAFELSGPWCRAVLAKLCPLDLHPSVFPPGGFARTVMEHQGAFVSLIDATPTFVIMTARSTARSLHHAIVQAADAQAVDPD